PLADVDGGSDDPSAGGAELDDDEPGRGTPSVEGLRQRSCARIGQRLVAIHEETIHRRGEGKEQRIVAERRIPPQVPGGADPFAPKRGDYGLPRTARPRTEREMY